jgi:hypothetical protein
MKFSFLSYKSPHRVQVRQGLSRNRTANDVGIVFEARDHLEPCDGGAAERPLASVEIAVVPLSALCAIGESKSAFAAATGALKGR